jgi:hydroxypyruvate reductase
LSSADGPVGATLIEEWFAVALRAVDPQVAVRRHLSTMGRDLIVDGEAIAAAGRLLVVAVGKAAIGMARGVEAVCGARISAGIIITKDGHAAAPHPRGFVVREASHPIPDERGVAATQEALELLATAHVGDLVLALISGGGSALIEAPRPPVSLAEMAATTDLLLKAGAPIQDLNAVRVPLSLVKGGGLRRAAGEARFATLLLSDVLGNDPSVIASGPTVPTAFTRPGALAVLERYRVRERVPATVLQVLSEAEPGDREAVRPFPDTDRVVVVGDNNAAVESFAEAAGATGRRARIAWRERQGEAAELGRAWVEVCAAAPADVDVLIGGGEATVTVHGDGRGGRNTEFALAAAIALAERELDGWAVASLATDGQDALTGVAGAVADAGTVERARTAGVDPATALLRNDSLRVFEAAGGLVAPGPTGTNVNDLYAALRHRPPATV